VVIIANLLKRHLFQLNWFIFFVDFCSRSFNIHIYSFISKISHSSKERGSFWFQSGIWNSFFYLRISIFYMPIVYPDIQTIFEFSHRCSKGYCSSILESYNAYELHIVQLDTRMFYMFG
jgi:hypothetical protein